jgi:hypothetical protein
MKTCITCNNAKEVGEFGKDNSKADLLTAECKACRSVRAKEWRAKNPGKATEYSKKSKQKHPETSKIWQEKNKDKINANRAKWRAENLEKSRESSRKSRKKHIVKARARDLDYYYAHREEKIEYSKQWNKDNPERFAENLKKSTEKNKEKIVGAGQKR